MRLTKGFIHHLNPVSKGIYWQRVVIHYLLSKKSCKSGQRGNPAPVLVGRGSDSGCWPGAKARLLQLAASRSGWVPAQPLPVMSFLSLEFMMLVLVLMHKTPESNLLRDHGDKENFGKIKQKWLNTTRGRNPGAIFRAVFSPLSLEQQVKYFHSSLHKFVCNSVRKLHLKVRA